jgi:hypothetical protein
MGGRAVTIEEKLAQIAELLGEPCSPISLIADLNDMCPCGSEEVWPCAKTRAIWLATGVDEEGQLKEALRGMDEKCDAEQKTWEALHEADPVAAQRYALQLLGWTQWG